MATIAVPLMLAGTVMSAYGQIQQGRAAAALGQRELVAKQFEAAQLQQQAGQEVAAGQAGAQAEQRQATFMSSRALALASASGGGAMDPTVVKIISDIGGEGAYRGEVAQYRGAEAARQLNLRAQGSLYEGEMAKVGGQEKQQASNIGAAGSLLSGAGTLYQKYGMGGPNPGPLEPTAGNPDTTTNLRLSAPNYG